jgi:hypothetical protein
MAVASDELLADGDGDGELVFPIVCEVIEVDPLVGVAVVDVLEDVLVPETNVASIPLNAEGHA